jgi:hypothetical protein
MKVIRPTSTGVFPVLEDGLHHVALGNMTQYEIAIIRSAPHLFIGIVGKKCYTFGPFRAHPSYVQEKLGLLEGDANNMADFINSQYGFSATPGRIEYHGYYHERLTSDVA